MGNVYRINEGDTGIVKKGDAGMTWIHRAEVIKTALCEGDVWGFRDLGNGREIFTTERFTFYRDKASAT